MPTPTVYGRYPSSSWKAPVADAAHLPLNGNTNGDARVTLDSDDIYVWNGIGWLPVASPAAVTAITALLNTSDVTANGPGAVPATVNSVGGSSAANIHTAELAANAATSSNTPNTIVKRDGSGNFSAGTITANLTGNATGITAQVISINSNTSAVVSKLYLCDTSGGSFTVTLPVPSSGAIVSIKDKTGSFQTNNLSIAQHASEKIEGLAATKLLQTNWGAWSFFSDGTDWYMGPF